MNIGSVKEAKTAENRVGLTPYGTRTFVENGHRVFIEKGAGLNSGFEDIEYKKAGAQILPTAEKVFQRSDMVIKVKEPQIKEFKYFRPGLILYTYLHLAAEKEVTQMLLDKKVTGIAYETVELGNKTLPLLAPMSEVAGKLAVQIGAWFLQKPNQGGGILLGGVPGVASGKVVILGGGIVGTSAAKVALGMGAKVTIFERNIERLRYLDDVFSGRLETQISNSLAIEKALIEADLVISGVLIIGAKAPRLVTKQMLKKMKKHSVIVDVSIDQGGSTETSHPTTHINPTYEVDGVIHYCVTNMPSAVPNTSTLALTNATIKYAVDLANKGFKKAVSDDQALFKGVNTYDGKCTYQPVAEALNLKYTPLTQLI